MSRFARTITIVVFSIGLSCAMQAQERNKTGAATVAGKWTVSVKGSPHGDVTMGFTLEQNGKKVKGTFASPHGDHPVEGDFVGGALKLATIGSDDDTPQVTFHAKLKEDDTLEGYLSSPMGDMTWTARRVENNGK